MYAGRKRRKPLQKGVKPAPTEGAKSNPSKRHRDRLNSELDRLASLLPFSEDVIASLDKLSILRLSVSFLRTKGFFSGVLNNLPSDGINKSSDHGGGGGAASGAEERRLPEGELLLQALNGFVLVVTTEGNIFFCSHTIRDYLGFHQTDVMHQSVFEMIHTEDQQEFRRNLHWGPDTTPTAEPETDGESVSTSSLLSCDPDQPPRDNSSFLDRSFICRFRCLLDNTSGFLALNIQGRLKFLHGQHHSQRSSKVSSPPQLALFAIATPLQPPTILEIRTRNMIFRTKHKLDFTPMACDAKGKIVLGYTEAELRVRGSGYQFIHAADMLYCAENHVRMIKTGESGLTVFRLLTKDNRWKWVQANARLVYKNGKPDYIVATQRPLVDEEGGEHLRKRSMHLPFTFATGEAMLYQTGHPLHSFSESVQGKAKGSKTKKGKQSSSDNLDPKSLLGALMSQDESVYVCQPDSEPAVSGPSSLLSQQQTDSECSSFLGHNSLHVFSNETSSYDPLLATLDSLTLDGEDPCSNTEIFNALENLGLNAEDLELLLLDERMIQVELGPNHIPTLSDLLTNNEILSYIHNKLENSPEPADGDAGRYGVNADQAAVPEPPAFVQQSQQMQQHVGSGVPAKAAPPTAEAKGQTRLPNGHWVTNTANAHQPDNQVQPHPVLTPSRLNSELKHLLESSQQWSQDQLVHYPSHPQVSQDPSLLGFHNQRTINASYIPNGHTSFLPSVEVGHTYSITAAPCAPAALLNGLTAPDVCHYQSYQQQVSVAQSSTLELEQLLGLSQSQHSLPAYAMFNTSAQGSAHSKLENGCLLNATNAAYIRTCLMPNGNAVVAANVDGLSTLQDHQKPGFLL
ncbi:hypothetical protein fugu_002209 [Takifugu bimaculatus]|uniref:Aryl hydrocarbon receptor n=1 Tax=Takifugu bimaculatus TaxID=433685 RepID=A0A4Z2BP06_9TELE|nr:hypothetical protein fugu_002209 [Takifugu bimaculatus]